MNYGLSKSAKIVLSKSIFDVKKQLILSKRLGGRRTKPINEKLRLRPINRLIGSLVGIGLKVSTPKKVPQSNYNMH